jgi:hypothetical protein
MTIAHNADDEKDRDMRRRFTEDEPMLRFVLDADPLPIGDVDSIIAKRRSAAANHAAAAAKSAELAEREERRRKAEKERLAAIHLILRVVGRRPKS